MSELRFEDIRHSFDGVPRVRGVSLAVGEGTITCLLGPSGCGKTTLLRLAAGLEVVQQGRIVIGGAEVGSPGRHVPPEHRNVGLMFQDFALFPHLNVRDNVGFGLRHLPGSEIRAAIGEALERVGMAGAADSYPHSLSGGEQQRVALARALAPRPGLMLLDEPFSSLDAQMRGQVRRDTASLLKELGTTTLMVTHDPAEASDMADQVALMRDGEILQQGTMEALYSHPQSSFCATFLGEINRLDGHMVADHAETVIGRLCTAEPGGLADGVPVDVLVRPEGLHTAPADGPGPAATITSVRGGGPLLAVKMMVDGDQLELTARSAAEAGPRVGDRVSITADPAMVFVFPRGDR